MVPKGGLEPPWLAPHAPQTCVSTNSTTSALVKNFDHRDGREKPTGICLSLLRSAVKNYFFIAGCFADTYVSQSACRLSRPCTMSKNAA
jgi:hypothetical protein